MSNMNNIEFLDADPDFDDGYLRELNEQANASFELGRFVAGHELQVDHERQINVVDRSSGAQKLEVHVGDHT